MNPKKAGYKTTEFWTVIVSYVMAFLVAGGHITQDDAGVLAEGLAQLIAALVPFFAVLVNLYYIKKRSELKKTVIETDAKKETFSVPDTTPPTTVSENI